MIKRDLITIAFSLLASACAAVAQPSLPSTFKTQTVASPEGADIFVRSAGSGPVVVLLHGYAETSDSWALLAAELVVQGRERIYLDRIWNAFSGDPGKPDEAARAYYAAQYAQPGAMRAGFAHFTAFSQDVEDNKIFRQTKLTMPVLAVGGEKSFGATEAVVMRNAATNVREAVVPGAVHWLMEENPSFTVALIQDFLKDRLPAAPQPVRSSGEQRVTPGEFTFPA